VGERWNLLVIRDLITGPKRFTDLMDRLGGITPKTLSQRLSELEDAGIVIADREPGQREVWYRLTPAGADLGPVIGMLNWWGLRHAWRWPQAGEPLHAEHLLRSAIKAIDLAADDHQPARWHFRLDGTDYLAESNGAQWSVTVSHRRHRPTSRSPRPLSPWPPSSSLGRTPASTSPAKPRQPNDSGS
jgi:DNA-binding HxlR family transcriptional regulator